MSHLLENRLGAMLVLLGCVLLGPVAASGGGLMAGVIQSGHGVELSDGQRLAARALREAIEALDGAELKRAESELAKAGKSEILGDFVSYYRARLAHVRGEYVAAAALAAKAREEHPTTPLLAELARLRGDALSAMGSEPEAREAWSTALDETSDLERRREPP